MKRRGYWKQSKPGWWESEWTRCGSVHETRYYFTPLLPICNDLIQKSTPYVAVPLYVKLPLLYCLTILFFPTPGKSPPYKHNLKQVIVFYFHSNGWYHNFKVYASSSGACNSVTSNMKAEEGKKKCDKRAEVIRTFSASSWALKLFLKCISSSLTINDYLNCLLGSISPYTYFTYQTKVLYVLVHLHTNTLSSSGRRVKLLNTSHTHF